MPKTMLLSIWLQLDIIKNMFNNDLTDWNTFKLIPDVQNTLDVFYYIFMKVINKHAVWKLSRVKSRHILDKLQNRTVV